MRPNLLRSFARLNEAPETNSFSASDRGTNVEKPSGRMCRNKGPAYDSTVSLSRSVKRHRGKLASWRRTLCAATSTFLRLSLTVWRFASRALLRV